MQKSLLAACVQYCATSDLANNLRNLERLISDAVRLGAEFVALPEACDFLSDDHDDMKAHAQPIHGSEAFRRLSHAAARHHINLLIGSLTVRNQTDEMVNRSLLVNREGALVAYYDKIHMFDANIPGKKSSRESALYKPGSCAQTALIDDIPFGFSICYDLRFPHLYRNLAKAGATLVAAPAAFMKKTGEAHWSVLVRARAIENSCFMIAPGQCGNPYGDRESYGHSMIVDPWGRVLTEAGEDEGVVTASIDFEEIAHARSVIMSLDHDREFVAPKLVAKMARA